MHPAAGYLIVPSKRVCYPKKMLQSSFNSSQCAMQGHLGTGHLTHKNHKTFLFPPVSATMYFLSYLADNRLNQKGHGKSQCPFSAAFNPVYGDVWHSMFKRAVPHLLQNVSLVSDLTEYIFNSTTLKSVNVKLYSARCNAVDCFFIAWKPNRSPNRTWTVIKVKPRLGLCPPGRLELPEAGAAWSGRCTHLLPPQQRQPATGDPSLSPWAISQEPAFHFATWLAKKRSSYHIDLISRHEEMNNNFINGSCKFPSIKRFTGGFRLTNFARLHFFPHETWQRYFLNFWMLWLLLVKRNVGFSLNSVTAL